MTGSLETQVGGSHYKNFPIQPVEFIVKNRIPFLEASVIKYVSRHLEKGGKSDIEKAMHFLQMILEFDYAEDT
tara:strand:- start:174 stop:392 length:219 start_codon:yes stop_codon:yes gene_type:complete